MAENTDDSTNLDIVGSAGVVVPGMLLVLIQLPPLAAGIALVDLVVSRPVLAVVLLVAWETVVVGGFLFGGAVAGKLIARASALVASSVESTVNRLVCGRRFARRYRGYVLNSCRYIGQEGLKTPSPFTIDLEDVFVDIALSLRAPHQVSADILARLSGAPGERQSLHELLDRSEPMVLAILGAPGSGKTTLLCHTALQICRKKKGQRPVPILLHLRDHAKQIVETSEAGLPNLLAQTLSKRNKKKLTEPPDWFQRRLANGECTVLLDGLDEVADAADRRKVVRWLNDQIALYENNHFVVTSRPHGYCAAPVRGAVAMQTQPLTCRQVDRFVHRWYLANERDVGAAHDSDERWERATAGARELLDRLRDHGALQELTANPLLLTMIANVHRYRGLLPQSRAELYREVCDVVLWRRREAIGVPPRLPGPQSEVVLGAVAHTMMEHRVRDLTRDAILAAIKPALARISHTLRPEEFLADLTASGLVIEREDNEYAFAHQTFQEYLAAVYLGRLGVTGLPENLRRRVGEDWWREVFLLYGARFDASAIVRACLDVGSVPALALAFECTEQPGELDPELRQRLNQMFTEAFGERETPELRLVVGVMAMRHLRAAVDLPGGGLLHTKPIPVWLYQLFQNMADNGHRHIPDAPPLSHSGAAHVVVHGARGEDAVAFTEWVNGLFDGARRCRLPTRAELTEHASQLRISPPARVVWTRTGDNRPDPWSPSGSAEATIDAEAVTADLVADLRNSELFLAGLLLVRSAVILRALARALDNAGNRANASPHARRRIRDLTRELVHALDRDLPSASALDRTDALGNLASARILARTLDRVLERAITFHDALTLAGTLGRDLDDSRARAGDLARHLTLDLASDRGLVLDHGLALDRFVGTALSHALSHAQATTTDEPDPDAFVAACSEEFVATVGIGANPYHLAFGSLAGMVRTAVPTLLQHLDTADEQSPHAWAAEVSDHLVKRAVPVFSRLEPLTAPTATAIRLSALCLAAEADVATGTTALGNDFRTIAAGVTLLQRRHTGDEPATEVIILAT